jgi:hypothetical protein
MASERHCKPGLVAVVVQSLVLAVGDWLPERDALADKIFEVC